MLNVRHHFHCPASFHARGHFSEERRLLTRIEQLPPAVQEEAAAQLEILAEAFEATPDAQTNRAGEEGASLAAVWRDLAWDDEVEAFDRKRHALLPRDLLKG